MQERTYGCLLADAIMEFRPEVVLSANAPLATQARALAASKAIGARFVYWLQDLHGLAAARLLPKQLGWVGHVIGLRFKSVERKLLLGSDAIVTISDDFRSVLEDWAVDSGMVSTIPNWASPEELPTRPKDNPWSRAHHLSDKFCFLYSGTLGMKHNPDLLLQLAIKYRGNPNVRVVVISEGAGADWLKQQGTANDLEGMEVLPFQAYGLFPDVMGAADVLVAILEPDAGAFSVPSKVLSYFCAARPLLLAVPPENLAARTVLNARAGVVVAPTDMQGFLSAADNLLGNHQARAQMQKNALAYATNTFDIDKITDRFEGVLKAVSGG